jgi:hypothetical protein
MKMQGIVVLFFLLVIILAIHPKLIPNLYNNILGRLVILIAIIYCTMNDMLAGLLLVLCLIIILNHYATFTEGMDILGEKTIGDDNVVAPKVPGKTINVVTNGDATQVTGSKLSDLKAQLAMGAGVDIPAMQQTLNAVPSNTLPISKMISNENVAPASQGTLETNTLTENFCSKCAGI